MKAKLPYFIVLLASLAFAFQVAAQGTTAFTYQGQLHDGGTNANGTYTMIFALFDSASGNTQIGSAITTSATVANGLFTVDLDFGAGAYNGGVRWLDITITNGGVAQTLSPRVQILPTPYAQFAAVAATVTNGAIMNAQLAGNAVASVNIQNNAVANQNLTANAVNATNIASGQVVKSFNGLTDAVSMLSGANLVLTTNGNGLQISAGSNVITAVDGNLRIVRGVIKGDGTIFSGSGFSMNISPAGTGGNGIGSFNLNQGDHSIQVNQNQRFSSGNYYIFMGGGFYLYQGETFQGTNQFGVSFYNENFSPSYAGPAGFQTVTANPQLFPVYNITFDVPFSSPPSITTSSSAPSNGGELFGFSTTSYYVNVGRANLADALSGFHAVVVRSDITAGGAGGSADFAEGFDFMAIGPQ